jgi:uncharacterized protein YbaP (TraB family)
VQDYVPDPAIWLLADEDTRIYLFGTIHALPEGFRWRSARLEEIVAEADELVVETSEAEADTVLPEVLRPLIAPLLADKGPTVSERLSPESGRKWLSLADMAGMPTEALDRMPIMLSLFALGFQQMQDTGSAADHGVETVLEAEFAAAGKPIGSIEDAADVMRAVLAIDEALMIEELERLLAEWDGTSLEGFEQFGAGDIGDAASEAADPFAMEHDWAQGRLSETPMFDDSALGRALHKVLLADRNRAWAGWLDTRLDTRGTVLLAVGAGHFEGEESVLDFLAERGLVAERLH